MNLDKPIFHLADSIRAGPADRVAPSAENFISWPNSLVCTIFWIQNDLARE